MTIRHIVLTACLALVAAGIAPVSAQPAAEDLTELRRTFSVGGRPVPPAIFREFGDGNLAESEAVWVAVDLRRAVLGDMYAEVPTRDGAWLSATAGGETFGYRFAGATANGLLVVVTRYEGRGSGRFFTLHLLDAGIARGLDRDGRPYERLLLTTLRRVSLGDRWEGDVGVSGDVVTVTTRQRTPPDASGPRTFAIDAVRP